MLIDKNFMILCFDDLFCFVFFLIVSVDINNNK